MEHYSQNNVFFTLLRAGLWEKQVQLSTFDRIDFSKLYRLAEEQSVVGLIAAGLEHVTDVKVPQKCVLTFMGGALQIEQQNISMNSFIGVVVDKLKDADIKPFLVKGQGVAQCYERPLWRACGDVDLILNNENYIKAKHILARFASHLDVERKDSQHLAMTINSWILELHGSLMCGLSNRIDRELDTIQSLILEGEKVRTWMNGKTLVLLPRVDEDVIYVFTHILEHFYKGGIGLRQICDWCRLLYKYRDTINNQLLVSRLKSMNLVTEWKAFAAFAVDYLGMPYSSMPLYEPTEKWKHKAFHICAFIMEVGNMGHNRDNTYYSKYPYLIRKLISMTRRCKDLWRHAKIFPLDSLRFFPRIVFVGLKAAVSS